ncbi:MAG: polyprenyl synthetase family protein [bacterium]|nr:polyprenyl synthetase family protein [bacterium]
MTSETPATETFAEFCAAWLPRVEAELERLLPPADEAPAELHAAMRHAMFPGGKRLRPMLALLGAQAVAGDPVRALRAAAGLECLHTYSLVHDDLPAMDDDDLRRGRPTCHVVYGEATALLAGDALLTLAFEAAADGGGQAVAVLARAAGSRGMVGGQVEDLAAEGADEAAAGRHTLERLQWIHDHKTGALIAASLLVGAHAATADGESVPAELLGLLRDYGDRLGRAFQIADDCLDLTGSAAELGKNPLADVAAAKLTWPALVGLEASLATARDLAREAGEIAARLGAGVATWRGEPQARLDASVRLLQDCSTFTVERRR